MALQSSGSISLNEIHIEAGGTTGTVASLNNSDIRGLIDKGAGLEMSMSEWYGASNTFSFSITSNTQEANLSNLATAAGWDGSAALACTINSNVYVWSDNTATPALLINVEGATVTNNGYIIGKGGTGGASENVGAAGGPAITIDVSLSFGSENSNVTIVNSSGAYIAGGGGGGGSGNGGTPVSQGGGGAGGGAGGDGGNPSPGSASSSYVLGGGQQPDTTIPGAQAGGIGGPHKYDENSYPSQSGGRVLPGTASPSGSHLFETGGGDQRTFYWVGGGGASSAGQSATVIGQGGGGGGWGASGGTGRNSRAGGVGGAAIFDNELNYALTNNGTIYGNT